MITKVRTHPSLFGSFRHKLCTNVKYREVSVPPPSKKERKSNRKTLYQVKNPKECWRSKNSSQLFPGTRVLLHNSHLPVKMHCLMYYYWGFKTCAKMCDAGELRFSSETLTSPRQIWYAIYVNILRRTELYHCTIIIIIIFSSASLQTYTMST